MQMALSATAQSSRRSLSARIIAAALLVAACAPVSPQAAPSQETAEPSRMETLLAGCRAEPVQKLVGRSRSDAVDAEALRLSGARTLRVIRLGQPVADDYWSNRLNLEIGPDGRIVAIRCG
jgi:hypothetical protein